MLSMTAIIDDMAHLYDYHLYGRTSACDYWLQSVWMSGNISLCLAVQSIGYALYATYKANSYFFLSSFLLLKLFLLYF